MSRYEETHKKWVSMSFLLGQIADNAHLVALQRNGRLDLMLRLLESERIERIKNNSPTEPVWSLDMQCSLSENWLLSAYEVMRAPKERLKGGDKDVPKLSELERRLAVVRMPIAKGEIQGMNRRANRDNPPMLIKAGELLPNPIRTMAPISHPSAFARKLGHWCGIQSIWLNAKRLPKCWPCSTKGQSCHTHKAVQHPLAP